MPALTCHHCAAWLTRGEVRCCETCRCSVCVPCHDDACPAQEFLGYEITPDRDHPRGGWQYVHQQYDGPPDPRRGHADTVLAAKIEIEDLAAIYPAMHQLRPLACHGRDR